MLFVAIFAEMTLYLYGVTGEIYKQSSEKRNV